MADPTRMVGESSSGATRPPQVTAVPLDSRVIDAIIAGVTERLRGESATGESTTAGGEAPTETRPAEARDGPGPREREEEGPSGSSERGTEGIPAGSRGM